MPHVVRHKPGKTGKAKAKPFAIVKKLPGGKERIVGRSTSKRKAQISAAHRDKGEK